MSSALSSTLTITWQPSVDGDMINTKAFCFADDSLADELDETFDAGAPVTMWKKMTVANIRAVLGLSSGRTGNDKVSRSLKQTIIAWRNQIPNAPPPEKQSHARGAVFYWMPPLRAQSFPDVAFDMAKERDEASPPVQ